MNGFTIPAAGEHSGTAMMKVSESVVARLSLYLRLLLECEDQGLQTISSEDLAKRGGTTSAQVRKDLSLFGTFGKRGLGYSVAELRTELRGILGLEQRWRVALVGAGKIGAALYDYEDFRRQGFDIEAVFDRDEGKIGHRWGELRVRGDAELEETLSGGGYEIVIVAVPAESAQAVVDRVVKQGVRGILNFAPTKLRVPEGVALKNVNMAVEMEGLSYALATGARGWVKRSGGNGGG